MREAQREDEPLRRADALMLLRRVEVGVVAAPGMAGRPPLAVPVRIALQPDGAIKLSGFPAAAAAYLLASGGGATLCVHDEQLPSHYVAVAGSLVVSAGEDGPTVILIPSDWEAARLPTASGLSPAGSPDSP